MSDALQELQNLVSTSERPRVVAGDYSKLWTVAQAVRELGPPYTRSMVESAMRTGALASQKVGYYRFLVPSNVHQWAAEHRIHNLTDNEKELIRQLADGRFDGDHWSIRRISLKTGRARATVAKVLNDRR